MAEKECFKCHQIKPIDEFYVHPMMADGHLNKCKECTKRDVQQNYVDNVERKHQYDRERNSTEERRAYRNKKGKERRRSHPDRYAAHTAVHNAIRDGRLEPRPCEVCGDVHVQAHHDDYSKPLDVRWLCFVHHRLVHGQKYAVGNDNVRTFKAA